MTSPSVSESTGFVVDWLEFSVTTDGEAAEAIVELFNRYGRGGVVVETPLDCLEHELAASSAASEVIVRTYVPVDGDSSAVRTQLEEGLWHLGRLYPVPQPRIRTLVEKDWTSAWKKQYHRIRVGRNILIVPAWEDYATVPGEVAIRLEPGMAFGTGLHPTTRQCLAAIEDWTDPGCAALDVGTGSGVLAIAAAKLGARFVLALDTDRVAVQVARENVVANNVAELVTVEHGSLEVSKPDGHLSFRDGAGGALPPAGLRNGHYELVLINILAPVIQSLAPALAEHVAPQGVLIAAGIIDHKEAEVVNALMASGLRLRDRGQEKDWVCLVMEQA